MYPAVDGVSSHFYSVFRFIVRPGCFRVDLAIVFRVRFELLESVFGLAEAVAGAVGFEDVHPVRQAVQQSTRQPLTTDRSAPDPWSP